MANWLLFGVLAAALDASAGPVASPGCSPVHQFRIEASTSTAGRPFYS